MEIEEQLEFSRCHYSYLIVFKTIKTLKHPTVWILSLSVKLKYRNFWAASSTCCESQPRSGSKTIKIWHLLKPCVWQWGEECWQTSIQSIDQLWQRQIYKFKGTAAGEDAQSVCVCVRVCGKACQVQMRSAYRLSICQSSHWQPAWREVKNSECLAHSLPLPLIPYTAPHSRQIPLFILF